MTFKKNSISVWGGAVSGLLLIAAVIAILHYTNASQRELTEQLNRESQSLLDEILAKAFDERTATGPVFGERWLTPREELGPDYESERIAQPDRAEGGLFPSQRTFNDIDDYDGYTRYIATAQGDTLRLSVRVAYVGGDGRVDGRTLSKSITIVTRNDNGVEGWEKRFIVNY